MGVFLFILLQGGLSEAVTYIFKYLVGLWNSYFPPLIFAHFMKYIRDTKCLRELQTAERKSLSVNLSALLIEGNLTVRTLETKRGEGAQRGCVEKPDYDLCPVGHPHVRTRTHTHVQDSWVEALGDRALIYRHITGLVSEADVKYDEVYTGPQN